MKLAKILEMPITMIKKNKSFIVFNGISSRDMEVSTAFQWSTVLPDTLENPFSSYAMKLFRPRFFSEPC